MSNNCLITKLKGTVTGGDEYLGKAYITVEALQAYARVGVICGNYAGGSKTIELVGEGDFAIGGGATTHMSINGKVITVVNDSDTAYDSTTTGYNWISFPTIGTYTLLVDKYNITLFSITVGGSPSSEIIIGKKSVEYLQAPAMLKGNSTYFCNYIIDGDIKDFVPKIDPSTTSIALGRYAGAPTTVGDIANLILLANLKRVQLSLTGLSGNLVEFINNHPNAANFTNIIIKNTIRVNIGDLATAIGSLTELNEFDGENNYTCTGSTESVAQAQVASGRTSGTLTIKGYMPEFVPTSSSGLRKINFGTSMVNPTEEEINQGYQIVANT